MSTAFSATGTVAVPGSEPVKMEALTGAKTFLPSAAAPAETSGAAATAPMTVHRTEPAPATGGEAAAS